MHGMANDRTHFSTTLKLKGRGYSPRSGVDWGQQIAPQQGGLAAADQLFAPQRGGQEKQLCYSPRSWASKSKITGKVI